MVERDGERRREKRKIRADTFMDWGTRRLIDFTNTNTPPVGARIETVLIVEQIFRENLP